MAWCSQTNKYIKNLKLRVQSKCPINWGRQEKPPPSILGREHRATESLTNNLGRYWLKDGNKHSIKQEETELKERSNKASIKSPSLKQEFQVSAYSFSRWKCLLSIRSPAVASKPDSLLFTSPPARGTHLTLPRLLFTSPPARGTHLTLPMETNFGGTGTQVNQYSCQY